MLASKNILQTKKAQARTTCVSSAVWRKMPSLSEAPRGAITVSVGDFASRRTCAGTHGVLFAALPGSAGADDCIVSETEPAKGKGGNFWRKDMKKSQFSRIWARCNKIVRVLESEAATFISRSRARCNRYHFPDVGKMIPFISRSRARCNHHRHDTGATCPTFHFPLTGEMQHALARDVGRAAIFHFPLTGEMQHGGAIERTTVMAFISRSRARCNGATFLPSNSACQEVHLREPAFAIFWNIDFSFRNRMFDVGSRQIA